MAYGVGGLFSRHGPGRMGRLVAHDGRDRARDQKKDRYPERLHVVVPLRVEMVRPRGHPLRGPGVRSEHHFVLQARSTVEGRVSSRAQIEHGAATHGRNEA